MTSITDLSKQVDALQAALDAEQLQIKAALDKLQEALDAAIANAADGGTAEERQALADKLSAIMTDLQSTIPDAPPADNTGAGEGKPADESASSQAGGSAAQ